jgi:hypothetical protein
VEGSREDGNEPSGFIKCWEVHKWLHNWQFLKKFFFFLTECILLCTHGELIGVLLCLTEIKLNYLKILKKGSAP